MLKQIMIPVAAFAITATGASAFNNDMLDRININLTDTQVVAFEEVHELREAGAEKEEIRDVLEAANIDRELMQEIRGAVREERNAHHEAIRAAIEDEDFGAFLEITDGLPIGDTVDTEDEFKQLIEAYDLREAGDREGAREIMEDLGFEPPHKGEKVGGGHRGFHRVGEV